MNTQPRSGIFPWFTIIEGIAGFFLQCWLFSSINAKGLLPTNNRLYAEAGCIAFENEAAMLFVTCSLHGVKAGCISAAWVLFGDEYWKKLKQIL